jgi:hypothetical protein
VLSRLFSFLSLKKSTACKTTAVLTWPQVVVANAVAANFLANRFQQQVAYDPAK